jgi:hypothetical protein
MVERIALRLLLSSVVVGDSQRSCADPQLPPPRVRGPITSFAKALWSKLADEVREATNKVHNATSKERYVCARRRVGEAAVSSPQVCARARGPRCDE